MAAMIAAHTRQSEGRLRFAVVVAAGWAVLALAAFLYARMKCIPAWTAIPAAAAFLVEFPFYLLPAFHPARLGNPWLLSASCLLPYLVYSVPTGEFRVTGFLLLLGAALAISFWYVLLPKSPATDLLFVALLAAIYLARLFDRIYLSTIPQLSVLGHAMIIRTGAIAILAIRGGVDIEFRFLPRRPEWIVGLRWFALLLPTVGVALWALGLWQLRPHPNLPLAIVVFAGMLWGVALSEEFFFRGLLQQWIGDWTGSAVAGLILASIVFGSAHLGVHAFPNWRYATVAGILGLFCGLAFRESRTIQAGMVTHAIAATLYRIFFQQ